MCCSSYIALAEFIEERRNLDSGDILGRLCLRWISGPLAEVDRTTSSLERTIFVLAGKLVSTSSQRFDNLKISVDPSAKGAISECT